MNFKRLAIVLRHRIRVPRNNSLNTRKEQTNVFCQKKKRAPACPAPGILLLIPALGILALTLMKKKGKRMLQAGERCVCNAMQKAGEMMDTPKQ